MSTADVSNRDSGLIYAANTAKAPGAAQSEKLDFRHADRADPAKLNLILWADAMGARPPPALLLAAKRARLSDKD